MEMDGTAIRHPCALLAARLATCAWKETGLIPATSLESGAVAHWSATTPALPFHVATAERVLRRRTHTWMVGHTRAPVHRSGQVLTVMTTTRAYKCLLPAVYRMCAETMLCAYHMIQIQATSVRATGRTTFGLCAVLTDKETVKCAVPKVKRATPTTALGPAIATRPEDMHVSAQMPRASIIHQAATLWVRQLCSNRPPAVLQSVNSIIVAVNAQSV